MLLTPLQLFLSIFSTSKSTYESFNLQQNFWVRLTHRTLLILAFIKMAAVASLSFSALSQCSERKVAVASTRFLGSNSASLRLRTSFSYHYVRVRASNLASKMLIQCMSSATGWYAILLIVWFPLNCWKKKMQFRTIFLVLVFWLRIFKFWVSIEL